jgi:hypothetical protein
MQAVERIQNRNTTKNFWLHVAFQAVHGGNHRSETDSCDLLPPGTGAAAQDGYRNAGYGKSTTQYTLWQLYAPLTALLLCTTPHTGSVLNRLGTALA